MGTYRYFQSSTCSSSSRGEHSKDETGIIEVDAEGAIMQTLDLGASWTCRIAMEISRTTIGLVGRSASLRAIPRGYYLAARDAQLISINFSRFLGPGGICTYETRDHHRW
ncbi:hypothetical protein PM082_007546 [Marasmius tenuissimus]|nr:hypothetical protein PM082_007546 [Marasmius tenuissimus]